MKRADVIINTKSASEIYAYVIAFFHNASFSCINSVQIKI